MTWRLLSTKTPACAGRSIGGVNPRFTMPRSRMHAASIGRRSGADGAATYSVPGLPSPRQATTRSMRSHPPSHPLESGTQLQHLQNKAFAYFQYETNLQNGLVSDKTAPDWPASIAATGLALSCYPVAVERGLMSRRTATGLAVSSRFRRASSVCA